MHREISHAEHDFQPESNRSLYLLTALIGLLIGLDLWPALVRWAGLSLPTWPQEFYGPYRFALLAAVLGGARILYGSIESLLEGKLGADLALAIACIAAILIGEPMVAAEVVFIGMVGECLESFTFARTQRAIRKIVEVCPRRCWLLRDGQEVRVLTSEVHVGDRVVVKPGARVPVDGVVTDGRSAVDASALTGESFPVDKMPGDEVLAGSLNQFGALTIEARRVAEHTVVGRVIELTARALKDKAPLERTADRLARYFLPLVLGLAAITFLACFAYQIWITKAPVGAAARLGVYPMLAVLVVSCPCALILATPAAIIAAMGRLAGTGILIKGGSALERLARVSAFAFDKTGTLTEGRLEMGEIVGLAGVSADEVLRTAATAEQCSEHPIALAILQQARMKGLTFDPLMEFTAQPGSGVVARTAGEPGNLLLVGTRRLLEEKGVSIPDDVQPLLDHLDQTGQTALLVARDGMVLGVIGARDRVRAEAAGVIAELRGIGIQDIALLTGDRLAAARTAAAQVGISDIHAELLPDQKAEFVGQFRQRHARSIAMVGDGINDAPALARADVGLAIGGTGTDVAAEAGDVVFMGDPLKALPLLVRLSRETVRIIRQNILIFAFAVNGLGVVLTAWLWPLLFPAWYEQAPLAGVIYHQAGSLAVLLNAMRLLWFERSSEAKSWKRTRHFLGMINDWLEHYANFDELLHWLSHKWKTVTLALAATGCLVYGLSGLTRVEADEVAVVLRFGKPLDEDLQPGLHWCWPWPVDRVVRIQPDRVRTVTIGFRGNPASGDLSWSSSHGGESNRVAEESVMVTGDPNGGDLVELQATLRYTIDRQHLHAYLFEVGDPEKIVRAATEAALREAVAGQRFQDLLTVNRQRLAQSVLARLQRHWLLPEYGGGLGIRIDGLSVHDLHPPQEVVSDYHKVAQAMEQRDRKIHQARAEAVKTEGTAVSESLQTVREAKAQAHDKVLQAEAARDGFLARLKGRNELSTEQEHQLAREASQAIADGQKPAVAYANQKARRQELLAAQQFLTDLRMSLEILVSALKDRPKVIVDSDKVKGRRHLLMFDPEIFRLPMFPPRDGAGDNRGD